MKKQFLTIALTMTFGIFSMSLMAQEHDHSKMNMDHEMLKAPSHKVDVNFQKQLNTVFQSSLKLNESFMTEDIATVKKAAMDVRDQIGKADMMLLKGQAHMDWMNYLKTMNGGLDHIIEAASINHQRTAFSQYNKGLYQSIKVFKIGETAYYQYCPMANNNKGAFWLSDSEQIKNPYMGAKMPKCGSVKETLK